MILSLFLSFAAVPQQAGGQWAPRLEIAWNRYYDYDAVLEIERKLADTWPEFIQLQDIGESHEGRPMQLMVLTNRATGAHDTKPAMWVDGNVHGNEVQGAEAALYLAWWLLEHYADNERAHKLLDGRTFYILPSQNPDGRDHWFHAANDASSSRSGVEPTDNDRDGLYDEDGPNDLDGDGEITQMRKRVQLGEGSHRLDRDDLRVLVPVRGKELGDWIMLGDEGIDDDGDGRVDEDGLGGYDMNRNWPSDWQPNFIQYGAGDYPFSFPETAAIGRFLLSRPNVAAVQSFHNSGGMILRGPGADYVSYPRSDIRVYDEIGAEGERMLPFYNYMIIHADLYTVHGGFVNWTYEGLGIFSFTNELWASPQYWGKNSDETAEWFVSRSDSQLEWNDSVMLGDLWTGWKPFNHPEYGEIEIGGFKRQHGRVAPSFMIEEMLHRNAMFCARHAEEIAEVSFARVASEDLGGGLWRVTAVLANEKAMPSRSGMAAQTGAGAPDRLTLSGVNVEVVAGGEQRDRFKPELIDSPVRQPGRLLLDNGVPGHGRLTVSWLVRGAAGAAFKLRFEADKAAAAEWVGELGAE